MQTSLNHDEWTKVDLPQLGWDDPTIIVKDLDYTAVGTLMDAEIHSPDGRSGWFLLCINGDYLVATVPQGDTLDRIVGLAGTP